jgi:polysaccharide biosynthesis protein PslG
VTQAAATTRRWTILAVLGALVAACLVVAACLPASAHDVRVRHTLFGVHDASLDSFGGVHEGSIRLWDAGVQWQEIEKRRGHYHWARLDQLVTAAQAAHTEVTFVIAMTPHFYSSSPTKAPRSIAPFTRFVRAVMKRYRVFHGSRGIAAYQVWNEANIPNFWTGTQVQMAKLVRAADRVRDKVDPGATVVAPPMTMRLGFEAEWMKKFYAVRLGGTPVWRHLDVVALNLYPLPTYGRRAGTPEDSMSLLAQARASLRHDHVPASKPIWNTEVNYGLTSGKDAGHPARRITAKLQASYVVRTYLLNAARGVKRVFWYRYDMNRIPGGGPLGNTLLSTPGNPAHVTTAGHALVRAQRWMHGQLLGSTGRAPCVKDRHGTYRCVVRDASGTRRIYWNPFRSAQVTLAGGAHHLVGVLGGVATVHPHAKIRVGRAPVMATR